jgi:hypothetical protein
MSMRREWEEHRFKKIKSDWNLYDRPDFRYRIDRSEMFDGYDVVRGHFPYYRYYHLKENHGWKMITWVRDPIERLLSQYNHFRTRPLYKKVSYRRIVKRTRKINIVQFSKIQSNFLTRYLGEDPSIYDFIGVVEEHDESIKRFNKQFGLRLIYEKHNVHTWLKAEITDDEREKIKRDHKKDYKFLEKMKDVK